MTCSYDNGMVNKWNEEHNEAVQPIVREYTMEDLPDVLYVLLLEAVEGTGSDFGAFINRAESLRPDRLRHALDLCARLIVAADLHTGRIIGVGGVSCPTDWEGEYWHIVFLSALDHRNRDSVIRKLLSELEGRSFSSPQCSGLTIVAPRRIRPLLAHRGYSTIALNPDEDTATMTKQSDPTAYQNIPMSFLDFLSADAAGKTNWPITSS